MSEVHSAAITLLTLSSLCAGAAAEGPPQHFVRLADIAPGVKQDMRYAGENNFTGRPAPGYAAPRCWLRREVAEALAAAQKELESEGLRLVVYDCYRPQRATKAFIAWAQDGADQAMKALYYPKVDKQALFDLGYIAKASAHSTGLAVDLAIEGLDFGTPFDLFDEASATDNPNVDARAKANRAKLFALMQRHGFANLPQEWWHFALEGVENAPPQDFERDNAAAPGLAGLWVAPSAELPMQMTGCVLDGFRTQADACRKLGSPFTGTLCDLLAETLDDAGGFGRRVLNWGETVQADALALRAAGALHALACSDVAPDLADVYPPRAAGPEELSRAVAAAIAEHDSFFCAYLDSAPQTNEVARSGAILGGFLMIAAETGLPLALYEIGASAGLNLGFDHYRYDLGVGAWGGPDAPVVISCDWRGPAHPPLDASLEIAARAGCDLRPIDPASPAARARLLSYIWADQPERLARAEAALDMAKDEPWRVQKADAADWVEAHFAGPPRSGQARVLMHTIMWQYLPEPTKSRIQAAVAAAGLRASADAPLAWLRMEEDGARPGAGVCLTLWPGGRTRQLGRGDFHGRWVWWDAPAL